MQYKLLKQMLASLSNTLMENQRCYALDDNHVALLTLGGYLHAEVEPDDHRPPRLNIYQRHVEQRGDEKEISWESIDLESLSGRHLVQFAELRGMVEKWVAGELDELPISTADYAKIITRPRRYRR